MATQLAERGASPVDVFRQTLSTPAFKEQLQMALPNHISVDRFIRVAQTAVQNNPDLLNPQKVERRSLFGALTKAAQDGLLPDGHEGAIIPFKGKAVWQPMVAGIMKKVRNSGMVSNWEVAPVFEKDEFERLLGDDQRIYHKPYEDGDPGDVIGAYSIVTLKDGSKSRDYLPRWRIDKALAQNPMGANSLMRTKFFDEAAVKTVIKHHAKRLPMSTDIEAIIERDEFMTPSRGYVAAPPTEQPKAIEEPRSRLDLIEHQIDEEPEETPEIEAQAEALEEAIEEAHPGAAKAAAIIAEINAAELVADVKAILDRYHDDIDAMPGEIGASVEVAADKRRKALKEPESAE